MAGKQHVLAAQEAIAEAIYLKDLDFTDIYISETGEAFMRGLSDVADPIYDIPENAIQDLDMVHKKVCGLGQLEREFVLDHDEVRYRVTKIQGDTSATYHVRRSMFPIPRIGKLGINPMVVRALGTIGHPGAANVPRGSGLILVAGATGQGKTTTASSLLQEYLITYGDIAITIEDPPELKLEGMHGKFGRCFQTRVIGGDFAPYLRAALRQMPRFILLGEIRDPSSASEVLNAALSGHVVIATIHGGSIEEALTRVIKYVQSNLDAELARSMLADGIAAVVHQEMRRIRANDGRVARRIFAESLFFGHDKGLRQKIRDGKIVQLSSDIDLQKSRMDRGEMPVSR
ncbi:ATPase, T2SS/T4P/T4SS family [Bosea sp. RAC05]|uniref:ATPase, T2SS/T4P/T4SS family n=1 Tax=Bosea sp. RAC05 TaxID=1842539 RepID=UPI00083D82BB|nr:ATPase, T2SS/T4P/T4SS family [Bosea sp. RAC05]AOG03288.1 type II/IV secretion system family protein [Bosea sp. RAC05]